MFSIFEYIENYKDKYDLTFINSKTFNDIWLPFFDKKEIIITNNILLFIRHGLYEKIFTEEEHHLVDFRNLKKDLKHSFHNYNIKYNTIKYENIDVYYKQFVEKDVKNVRPCNINRITWYVLSIREFKNLIMSLNTKAAKQIRNYYITLEEIMFNYKDYIIEYNKQLIIVKDKEINKLSESIQRLTYNNHRS